MLTRQGWLLAAGPSAWSLAGRLLGIYELYVFGAVLPGPGGLRRSTCACGSTSRSTARSTRPEVHAGQVSRVELRVRNLRGPTRPCCGCATR